MAYAELLCRSNYSFLQGASHPEELVQAAHDLGYGALAISDLNGVYGLLQMKQTSTNNWYVFNYSPAAPGVYNVASATSVTPDCAFEETDMTNTQSAGTFTVNAPTGCTPTAGQRLLWHIKSSAIQTYSWNAAYVGGTTTLPTASSGSSKGDWIAFRYDAINSVWDYVATATGF